MKTLHRKYWFYKERIRSLRLDSTPLLSDKIVQSQLFLRDSICHMLTNVELFTL